MARSRSTWDKFVDAVDFVNDPLGSRYLSRAIDRILFPPKKPRRRPGDQEVSYVRVPSEQERRHTDIERRRSEVDSLLSRGKVKKAESRLKDWVSNTEAEAGQTRWGVTSIPYLKLAILYRKEERTDEEIQILRRYFAQCHGSLGPSKRLIDRLRQIDPPTRLVRG